MNAIEFANELRKIADLFEQHPDLPTPTNTVSLSVTKTVGTKESFAEVARILGEYTIQSSDGCSYLEREFGSIRLRFWFMTAGVADIITTKRIVPEREVEETEVVYPVPNEVYCPPAIAPMPPTPLITATVQLPKGWS